VAIGYTREKFDISKISAPLRKKSADFTAGALRSNIEVE
jgi:hypothetical protein